MNLKHGFDSTNTGINPDSIMISRAVLGSAELQTLVQLLSDENVNVGHLMTAYNVSAPLPRPEGVHDLKSWLWWLCGQIESQFDYESPQAKYANMVALMGSAINEFEFHTSIKPFSYIVVSPKPNSLDRTEFHMNSLMTKIKKLRAKF